MFRKVIKKDEIVKLHQLLLKRIPSEEELENYVKTVHSVPDLVDAILDSDEYKQNEENENKKKGPVVNSLSIGEIYNFLLGRGLSDLEKVMYANQKECASFIVYNIVNSDEYRQKREQISAREWKKIGLREMEQYYIFLLGREMSDEEKTLYENQKEYIPEFVYHMVESEEYKQKREQIYTREWKTLELQEMAQYYHLLLGRDMSNEEKNMFTNRKEYAPEFVYHMVRSEEYKQRQAQISAREWGEIKLPEMERYYLLLLGRSMSDEEKTLFVSRKEYVPEFVYHMVRSEEYKQRQAQISAREWGEIKLPEMEQYYLLLLGRSMSDEEKTLFASRKEYAPEFIYHMVRSEEYKQRQAQISAREWGEIELPEMEQYYLLLLGRNMSDEEKTMFVNRKEYAPEFVYNIVRSEEYKHNHEQILTREFSKNGLQEIEHYYQLLLDRNLSEEERHILSGYNGHITEILLNIINSDEFLTRKKKKSNITNLQLKSELMDTLLGRPIRDYEIEIFREQPVEDFLVDILSSGEYKKYRQTKIQDEIYQHKYGAATYKIMWDEPTTFTCVYDGVFEDVVTTEVRKLRAGIWKSQYELLKHFPKEGTFVDIGANIGIMSCMFESKGWNGYAIEASLRNADCIRKAIALNNLNIEVGQFAVYSETTSLSFLENGPWGLVENQISKLKNDIKDKAFSDIKYTKVQAFCLDDWEKTGLTIPDHVDYIKMDIEGSEIAALNGMKKFLQKYNYPIVFCESNGESQFHFGHTTEELHRTFGEMGYHRYEWKEGQLIACNEKKFQLIYSMDFVFIHEIPFFLNSLIVEEESKPISASAVKDLLINGTFGEKVHVCSELKDFKEYLADEEIKETIFNYMNGEDETLKVALNWYKEIGE